MESKIELGALQDDICKKKLFQKAPEDYRGEFLERKMTNLAPSWGPRGFKMEAKTLTNRCKKTMHFQEGF